MTTVDRAPSTSFPREYARTRRFTLGEPRTVTVTADGRCVLFVRTGGPYDAVGQLVAFDVATGTERTLLDPAALMAGPEDLSAEERARRERSRESGSGVTSYTVDDAGAVAVLPLSGTVWVCDLATGRSRELSTGGGAAIDPRVDPTGTSIAYAAAGSLRVVGVDGSGDRALAEPDGDTAEHVVWGQAEFVAAEEMDRDRGFWWAPDGSGLLVERYDTSPVPIWYLADPADPVAEPRPHRYPVAGSADAIVSLWYLGLDGSRAQIRWDSAAFPYLTRVSWTSAGAVAQVMSRDQRRARVLRIEPSGATEVISSPTDDTWIELLTGVPVLTPRGLLSTIDDTGSDTRRLALDGSPFSPAGVQVRDVLDVADSGVLVTASSDDPAAIDLLEIGWDGSVLPLSTGAVANGARGGATVAVLRSGLDTNGVQVQVLSAGRPVGTLRRHGADPTFVPQPRWLRTGDRQIVTAVLLPTGHDRGTGPLPVLLAPYGGPHGQLAVRARRGFLQAQYLADQGFCVVVADGRGTPGRGPAWEKAVRDEFATVTLDDQVQALDGVLAELGDEIDGSRVGILGWSYGGYLSALAVLARPDRFRAAVAGAPVTDWELYDTFYTERYLGHPGQQPDVYRRNSLLQSASEPFDGAGRHPALLILHGMVDDNVTVAHTLRLSSALLAAGRPHAVLPLTGVTHMTPQEVVAENLLRLQIEFLRRELVD
ncbi:MAG: S9 family peptidase [Williamsia herbipolensis]|nr:S9 family peptidase [Williamsia herbipolensis]